MAAAGVMLAGCAASGPMGKEVLTGSIKQDTARVVFYRTSALGFAVQPSYMIDGKAVANSQPGGFVVCDVKPGKHDVAVDNMALNANLFGGSDKASLDLAPGSVTYLHAQPQPGLTIGIITISQVAEAQGKADTGELHKIDAPCGA